MSTPATGDPLENIELKPLSISTRLAGGERQFIRREVVHSSGSRDVHWEDATASSVRYLRADEHVLLEEAYRRLVKERGGDPSLGGLAIQSPEEDLDVPVRDNGDLGESVPVDDSASEVDSELAGAQGRVSSFVRLVLQEAQRLDESLGTAREAVRVIQDGARSIPTSPSAPVP